MPGRDRGRGAWQHNYRYRASNTTLPQRGLVDGANRAATWAWVPWPIAKAAIRVLVSLANGGSWRSSYPICTIKQSGIRSKTCNLELCLHTCFFAAKSSTNVFPVNQKNQAERRFMTTAT